MIVGLERLGRSIGDPPCVAADEKAGFVDNARRDAAVWMLNAYLDHRFAARRSPYHPPKIREMSVKGKKKPV